jgi:hypothetical protein
MELWIGVVRGPGPQAASTGQRYRIRRRLSAHRITVTLYGISDIAGSS